jgi:hypothetical protein
MGTVQPNQIIEDKVINSRLLDLESIATRAKQVGYMDALNDVLEIIPDLETRKKIYALIPKL